MPDLQIFEFQGGRLAYRISGQGPPLVMIQGVGVYGGSGWNPLIDLLEKEYTCLSFDNRGMGGSQPPADHLTVDQMAADALALMEHAGWSSAHIVGHSLGGLIALQMAISQKTRIRSLAILNSFPTGAHATRLTLQLIWIGLRIKLGTRRMRRRAFMELVLPEDHTGDRDVVAERMSRVFGHDIADSPDAVDDQLKAMTAHDVTPNLGELGGIPTLVISSENDPIAPPGSGRAIAKGIPGARYIEIAGASHSFPVLEVERCVALLLEHLAAAETKFTGKS